MTEALKCPMAKSPNVCREDTSRKRKENNRKKGKRKGIMPTPKVNITSV
tara:strand:+ start:296 stop:442 length:147 start_codon:yes stop_codon:yes gene_type:complete